MKSWHFGREDVKWDLKKWEQAKQGKTKDSPYSLGIEGGHKMMRESWTNAPFSCFIDRFLTLTLTLTSNFHRHDYQHYFHHLQLKNMITVPVVPVWYWRQPKGGKLVAPHSTWLTLWQRVGSYRGWFFNCSAKISVLKRKTFFNQRGSFVHWEFHGSESLIGCPLFFIVSKLEVAPNAIKMLDGVGEWMDGYPLDCYDY